MLTTVEMLFAPASRFRRPRTWSAILLFAIAPVSLVTAAPAATEDSPEIRIADVDRFYELYQATDGKPSASQLQQDYLDRGSAGLLNFAKLRTITGESLPQRWQDAPGYSRKPAGVPRFSPPLGQDSLPLFTDCAKFVLTAVFRQ